MKKIFSTFTIAFVALALLVSPAYAKWQDDVAFLLPQGIMHAPGIEKRIETGKGLPSGIMKKIENDAVVPTISNFLVTDVNSSTAVISWNTNVKSNSLLFLDIETPVSTDEDEHAFNEEFTHRHMIKLTDLEPETTYFVVVGSEGTSENIGLSEEISFTTDPVNMEDEDTEPPVIDNIQVSQVTENSVHISWGTNEEATGYIVMGTSTPIVESESHTYQLQTLQTEQEIDISELEEDTQYFFVVFSSDVSGNVSNSQTYSFTTQEVDPVTETIFGPFIINVNTNSAKIVWFTTERSDAKIWLSSQSPVLTDTDPILESEESSLLHLHSIENLMANTTYYVVVSSSDASGNVTTSTEKMFVTDSE